MRTDVFAYQLFAVRALDANVNARFLLLFQVSAAKHEPEIPLPFYRPWL